jgi:hypothetical protein
LFCCQISDVNLQNCIAAAAGTSFDSLSASDLSAITILNCEQKGIASISGIQNLANLVELSLNDNRIADISPLAGLKQLKELYLWENQIEDIRPLAKLNMLEELLLGDNRIIDIGPLAGLTRLDHLEINNNRITDITPLKGLTRLRFLDGSGNSIRDINALLNLEEITQLSLNDNSITDIKGLAGLKSVRRLFLRYNRINDISSMAKLNELRNVDLSANSIEDITALRNLINLKRLRLDNNLVDNINPLAGLPNLNYISMLNNCIKNIGSFAEPGIIAGMEYQHDLCGSPNLFRKVITQEWLSEQTGKQCVDYDGENDYSLKGDYEYYPDGIYYNYYIRDTRGTVVRKTACRLPWNSSINDFLITLDKADSQPGSYEVLRFKNDHIYVKDGRVKGFSVNNQRKLEGQYSILDDIAGLFGVRYSLQKSSSGKDEILIGEGDGHVIRIVDTGEKYSLQFFEPGFYAAAILKQK